MKVTLGDVARFPRPGMAMPGRFQFSPDGTWLTFLWAPDGGLARTLWGLNLKTGEKQELVRPPGEGVTDANISREEALRRERMRQRETGVTSYDWAADSPVMLVPIRGHVYLWPLMERVASGAIDPKIRAVQKMIQA